MKVLFLCLFSLSIGAVELEGEAKPEPSLPQEEDLTSPTGGLKPVVGAGAAVTLPFVFESTSPIQPIMVEVKPDDRKDKPEVPPRQTRPWLSDVIIADDQGEFKPISSKGLVAVLPFPFRPSTKPWFVDDQSAGVFEVRPIMSQNGAAVTLPATIGGLRGAPQHIAPEEDLTSPLPGASPAPVAVAVPLPYYFNSRPRPQQKPWLVAVQTNDDSVPIGFTRPVFPDGAPVAAVRPDTNKVVGVTTLPFTFEKPSGSAIPIRQTKPFIVDQQGMFVPVRKMRPYLTQQPAMTLPFNFNNENQEAAVPIRQTKPWFVDSSAYLNANEGGSSEAQPNDNVIGSFIHHQRISFWNKPKKDKDHRTKRPFYLFPRMNPVVVNFRRCLNRAFYCVYLLPNTMMDLIPVNSVPADYQLISLNPLRRNLFFVVVANRPYSQNVNANALAGRFDQVSLNHKDVKQTISPGSDSPTNETFDSTAVRPQQVTTSEKQSGTETKEEFAEATTVEMPVESVLSSTQLPSLSSVDPIKVNEEGEMIENTDVGFIIKNDEPLNQVTEAAAIITVVQSEIRTAYCFTASLSDGRALSPCPLRRKRSEIELEESMELSVNEKLIQPSEIQQLLTTESPSSVNLAGSESHASEIMSSMKSSGFIEIKELGSPTMERLLQQAHNDASTTTITVSETVTQTIRLLAGNCVPQCLLNLPKCAMS